MGKRKINPKNFEKELPSWISNGIGDGANLIYDDGTLEGIGKRKLESLEDSLKDTGYEVRQVDLSYGDLKYVVMKSSLVDALGDPSSGDVNDFKNALTETSKQLKEGFNKKQLKPCESAFEENLFKGYVSSIMMSLVNYPHDTPNKKMLKEMGLEKEDVSKLYVQAATAWLGSIQGVEKIGMGASNNLTSCLDNIGYSGKEDIIKLGSQRCEQGSHYVLKPSLQKKLLDIQKSASSLAQSYLEIESQIVLYIKNNSSNQSLVANAVNFVRTYLNMACGHEQRKPLPLD